MAFLDILLLFIWLYIDMKLKHLKLIKPKVEKKIGSYEKVGHYFRISFAYFNRIFTEFRGADML